MKTVPHLNGDKRRGPESGRGSVRGSARGSVRRGPDGQRRDQGSRGNVRCHACVLAAAGPFAACFASRLVGRSLACIAYGHFTLDTDRNTRKGWFPLDRPRLSCLSLGGLLRSRFFSPRESLGGGPLLGGRFEDGGHMLLLVEQFPSPHGPTATTGERKHQTL